MSRYLTKTFVFNVLFLIVAVAAVFGYADYRPTPEYAALVTALVALINAIAEIWRKRSE
jgi:hypothetical protein